MSSFAVEAKDVTLSYSDEPVVVDVSFRLPKGSLVGVVGPNGAGKSTVIKAIVGVMKPDAGEIKISGEPVGARKNQLTYVPQRGAVDWDFPITAEEVVRQGRFHFVGLLRGFRDEDRRAVKEAMEAVSMTELADRQIGALSGGQQQRVFLARALVGEPKLLILDEPTVGIDAEGAARFYRLLDRLHREMGLTMFLVTHELEHVISYLDRVACLNRKLFFDGESHQFLENHREILSQVYGYYLPEMDHNNRWLRARGKEERSFTPSQ